MPDEREIYEGMTNVNECSSCLQSVLSNKTPGNDGITCEFYIIFNDLIKDLLNLPLLLVCWRAIHVTEASCYNSSYKERQR